MKILIIKQNVAIFSDPAEKNHLSGSSFEVQK